MRGGKLGLAVVPVIREVKNVSSRAGSRARTKTAACGAANRGFESHPARYKPTRSFLMSNICIGKGSSRKLLKAILRFSVFYLSMYRSTILKPLNSL